MLEQRKLDTLFPFHTTVFATAEERRIVVGKTPDERQTMIERLVFRYPGFEENVQKLVVFHRPVEEGHAQCGFAGGFIGGPRSGKSTVISAFRQMPEHGPQTQQDGSKLYPVAWVQGRSGMNNFDLVGAIFKATGSSSVPRMTRDSVKEQGARRILMSSVRLLIIDDAHHLFRGRRETKENVIDILVDLLNKRLCNILLVGVKDIDDGMEQFAHFHGRGHFPAPRIEPYVPTDLKHKVEFNGFLKGVSTRLPFLEESRLDAPDLFPHFVEATKGLKGAAMDIIVDAGCIALTSKASRVTGRHLYEACFKRAKPGQKSLPFQVFEGMPLNA